MQRDVALAASVEGIFGAGGRFEELGAGIGMLSSRFRTDITIYP